MDDIPDTLRVCFVPARNGTDVICRMPSGKVAFPSRFYWNVRRESGTIRCELKCSSVASPDATADMVAGVW